MQTRSILLSALVVAALVIGGGAAYLLFLRGDDVAPLALPSQSAGASAGAGASSGTATGSSAGTSLPPASGSAVDAASIPGTWTIGADSIVGYRVRERLASLSADSDAVGRTSSITGSVTLGGSGANLTVAKAEFSVDMTSLASDKQMRDNRLRNQGIETDTFTTSTFSLTQPVTLPAGATSGAAVDVTLHGDLTLHGVTKTVDIPARAQLNGNLIQVVGSLSFPFSDYDIVAPNIGNFVAVQDNGTLEFLVNLAKS
ncbi:MAG TPA: YceI family protein [Candidatus Limnocylindrales bacterium]|nr:YceI family protein [Candidatus Limnocylindrales bacterium]